jgi:hypothetical protein
LEGFLSLHTPTRLSVAPLDIALFSTAYGSGTTE